MKKRTTKTAVAQPRVQAESVKPAALAGAVPVRLELDQAGAESVCIAASFNQWQPKAAEMILVGEGHWVKDLVLPPGVYEYLFVVDGKWLPDPKAGRTVSNSYGGQNCLLEVGPA